MLNIYLSDITSNVLNYRHVCNCLHVYIGFMYLGIAGSCEHDNEPSGSMQGGEFLD
jgi:hypothetical protein